VWEAALEVGFGGNLLRDLILAESQSSVDHLLPRSPFPPHLEEGATPIDERTLLGFLLPESSRFLQSIHGKRVLFSLKKWYSWGSRGQG